MGEASPDLITFGETMALFMPTDDHRSLERSPVLQQGFGGAESNVAIGAARLGCSVGWFGRLGDDPFGATITKTLRGEGVDVSRSRQAEGETTGLMFREQVAGRVAVHYYRKNSAASRMQPQDLDAAYIQGSKILHVTGITTALSESCRQTVQDAVKTAREAGVKVCFDPNLRLKLWSVEEAREVLLPLSEQADYFLPGWDELQLLYDTEDADAILNRVKQLQATVIIKGYGEKTLIVENGSITEVPFYPADTVVDTVGAGDGFCAGFLAGILKGKSTKEAVQLASINGSLVVQSRGDWEALPVWKAVEQRLLGHAWVER
ncbi:sugar kinase [Paenibacillus daejeonensis]|uniref:sugar kinase n=1 Tax=Paenibacillus daejeonensis TaxID=135193 RepID=UPI00037B2060|nr:sugar kinase [Paenibacillus daejeonensis]